MVLPAVQQRALTAQRHDGVRGVELHPGRGGQGVQLVLVVGLGGAAQGEDRHGDGAGAELHFCPLAMPGERQIDRPAVRVGHGVGAGGERVAARFGDLAVVVPGTDPEGGHQAVARLDRERERGAGGGVQTGGLELRAAQGLCQPEPFGLGGRAGGDGQRDRAGGGAGGRGPRGGRGGAEGGHRPGAGGQDGAAADGAGNRGGGTGLTHAELSLQK